jgi:peptidyl-tRNA hydrolase, PTH1 family
MRASGSAGGRNGLQSIVEQLGTTAVPRLRVGIGRGRSNSIGHVLSRFSKEEEEDVSDLVERATMASMLWVREGVIAAMNAVNQKPKAAVPSTRDAVDAADVVVRDSPRNE